MKRRVPREFLGAFKAGHRRYAREFIDDEFSANLLAKVERGCLEALEALKWVTRFNNEHFKGVVMRDGTDFYEDQANPEQARLDLNNIRYARQMDAHTRLAEWQVEGTVTEDDVNALIDLKREFEKAKKQ
jgi:hypothetical protein